jgi:peptidoglycan/xylan/chitin deacetylase (PgdA/CDA1 family)
MISVRNTIWAPTNAYTLRTRNHQSLHSFHTNGMIFMKSQIPWNLDDFTLESYVDLLKHLKQTYAIVPFCRIPQRKNEPYLILRHDIDFSLPAALRMAKIEQALGVKSTYFVLISSHLYDAFQENNPAILKEISKLGHEIGLHYHPESYTSYNKNTTETLHKEIRLLENLTGKKVHSIARHGGWDRDPFASTREYINANHPFYRSYLFVHDSCRAWTTVEDMITLMQVPQDRAQLLTHPENWQEDKIDRQTLIESLTRDMREKDSWIKEAVKKTWTTDPLVLKYDLAIRDEKRLRHNWEQYSKPQTDLTRELSYYRKLIQWHLFNSTLGWKFLRLMRTRTKAHEQ